MICLHLQSIVGVLASAICRGGAEGPLGTLRVMPRPTLKDVADDAGVHISTASRALNPATASVVHPETVEKVVTAARRLKYRPHPIARGLRTSKSMAVGMVIPDVENPLFGPIIAGAESTLMEDGYSVYVVNADRGIEHAEAGIAGMVDRHVDGLIVATATRDGIGLGTASSRDRQSVPIVLVNRSVDDDSIPAIVGDDHAGIGLAVEHLCSLGHERIGHVAGPSWLSTGQARRSAFMVWVRSNAIDIDESWIEEAEWFQIEPGYKAARALLERHPEITAIVAANDLLGLGCYRAIRDSGREVGSDISVTGYNDMPLLDLMQPPMTSVSVPFRQMGSQAAATLLRMIGSGLGSTPSTVRLAPTLAVRASTALRS